ncbi:MAG: ComEC/Rec2 family competence protein, partial [Arenimonas sp.]|uniref:ComEC/Rec2 family competence protein n=1 Tax=Arenimonas sp. TaxID=1872635 RepID=UPI003C0D9207
WSAGMALAQRLPVAESGGRGQIIAEIRDLPQQDRDQWQFEAEVRQSEEFPSLVGRRIKLAWYRTQTQLKPGDVRHLDVTLRTPNGVYNPGGFDAEQRALQKRWAAQGYVREEIGHLGHRITIDRFRDSLSGQIRRQLGDPRARFVTALALGDTRLLQDEDWELLRITGITHLIAISGFHVGMVALAAGWLVFGLYRLWPAFALRLPQPLATAWAAMLAAGLYTAIAGFALPTVRTALMIAAFMACRLLGRHCSVIQAVALSMAVMLLWDPISILTPGFWLSFGGVLLLIAFMPRQDGQGILRPFLRAQWVASFGLLPLTVGFFGQSTLIGPAVNLLAIPWISLVVVPLALLGCVFSGFPAIPGAF